MAASILLIFRRSAAVLLPLTLAIAPTLARAGPWSFEVAGGAVTDFHYADNSGFTESFGPTTLVMVSADRAVHSGLSLRVESGYLGYGQDIGLVGIPESPPSSERLSAQFVPLALGVRAQTGSLAGLRTRAFAEIAPALYLARITRHLDLRSGGFNFPLVETVRDESFSALLPGLTAAAGASARLSAHSAIEWGARYLLSGRPGHHHFEGFGSPDFPGLNVVALTLGITWAP